MLEVLWDVIGNVKSTSTTKMWRLIVTTLLFLGYTGGVCFATWTFKEAKDLRAVVKAEYLTRVEYDNNWHYLHDELNKDISRLEAAVESMKESNDKLQRLLIDKFLEEGSKGTDSSNSTSMEDFLKGG